MNIQLFNPGDVEPRNYTRAKQCGTNVQFRRMCALEIEFDAHGWSRQILNTKDATLTGRQNSAGLWETK